MADLSSFYQTYNNSGSGVAVLTGNYKQVANVNGLGGNVRILSASKTNMTTAEVAALVELVLQGGTKGTDDAVSIAGIGTADGTAFSSGVTDVIYIAVQGTGVLTPGASYRGTGFTTALVAVFGDKNNV
jgi:hypothetical protein